jgi:membrane protease YdiL (CAAX protease family)
MLSNLLGVEATDSIRSVVLVFLTQKSNNSIYRYNSRGAMIPAYIVAIAGAEAIGAYVEAVAGAACHTILVLILLTHYALANRFPYRRALPVLALLPLSRLLSLTMPVKQIPQIYWYALVGIPLLIAVALTARLLRLSWADLGLCSCSWLTQGIVALSGLPLSIVAFLLLRPEPSVANFDWRNLAVGSLILMIFVGFVEEIIFRGLLHRVTREMFGRLGIYCSSVLFAAMYIGSLSPGYVIFIGLVGLFFGWCVSRTGSIVGVTLAHGVLNIGAMLVWPFLIN